MKKLCGIYVIRSINTDRVYYGSSDDCRKRKKGHLQALRNGRHHCIFLQRVFNKYGENDLAFRFVASCDTRQEAFLVEQYLLNKYVGTKGCMNISAGASGGDNLTHNPNRDKIIARMAKATQLRMDAMTDFERLEAFSRPGALNGMFGKTHSKKTRKRLSDVNIGPKPYLRKPKSEEGRANIKAAAIKRVSASDYVNPFSGKHHSDETKKKLSKIAKQQMAAGKVIGNSRRVKIGKKTYVSLNEASRHIGVKVPTIWHRIKSANYPDYSYKD